MTADIERHLDRSRTSEHIPAFVALAIFGLLSWIYFFPPGQAYGRGHDYLDHVFAFYVVRSHLENFFFDYDAVVPQLADGLAFNSLGMGDFHLGPNLYLVLPPFAAYVANELLRRTLALIGAYLLLQRYLLPERADARWIAALTALTFAMLPDQANRFGTIAMQPLLFWAMLNIWRGERRGVSWTVVASYPFYSFLYLGGFTICGYMLLACGAAWWLDNRNWKALGVVFLYTCAAYILLESRMFYQWFVLDYESYRHVLEHGGPSLSAFVTQFVSEFLRGNNANHVTGHSPAILAIVILTSLVLVARAFWNEAAETRDFRKSRILFVTFLSLVFFNAVVNALDQSGFLNFKYEIGFPFSFHRIDVTSPLVWRILLALSIVILAAAFGRRLRAAAYLLLALATSYSLLQFPGVKEEINQALGAPPHVGLKAALSGSYGPPPAFANVKRSYHPGYTRLAEYYKVDTFERIGRDLQKLLGDPSGYRTISLGISPSVSQFHGFYALDGLFYDVSSDYAGTFAELSEPEYAKDGLQPTEGTGGLVLHVSRNSLREGAVDFAFDACRFAAMGGRVLFSAWPIRNADSLGLLGVGSYDGVEVYRVAEPQRCAAS